MILHGIETPNVLHTNTLDRHIQLDMLVDTFEHDCVSRISVTNA